MANGHSRVSERVAALEAYRVDSSQRQDRLEGALDQIRNLGWAILGAVVVQVVITGLVMMVRRSA